MGGGGGPPTWGNEGPMYPPPFQDEAPPGFLPHHALPDLSRPPPGFSGPPPMLMAPIVYDEKQLIPTLPYFDLPAGLMVPLIPLEEVGYKPIDPKKIRLPPPTPPTAALIAALEQFYAPPSHERREILTDGKCSVFTNGRKTRQQVEKNNSSQQISQIILCATKNRFQQLFLLHE